MEWTSKAVSKKYKGSINSLNLNHSDEYEKKIDWDIIIVQGYFSALESSPLLYHQLKRTDAHH